MEKIENTERKIKKEDLIFVGKKVPFNIKIKHKKKELLNILITLLIISLIIILLFIYIISKSKLFTHSNKTKTTDFSQKIFYISGKYSIVYNNKTINDDPEFSKYQKLMPRINNSNIKAPTSIEEIFNAREIYISDVRITPDYIRYIRPINETEELKYKKPYSEKETIIDKKIFEKRRDQLEYIQFNQIALNEILIKNRDIKYENKPIISIIVPSFNKQDFLLKSIRSIQNQNFKNIEIIIVNDCSTDNNHKIFNYLLETDSRIRIFHHMTNLGLFRTRLDGILYSRGKYIITFDTGDIYEDNYVLTDAYNIIDKYNLDSCKFLFRTIHSFNYLSDSYINFHVGYDSKIVYGPDNIKALNTKVFKDWGNIWNRLVRANILIKGLLLFNELMLNVYKNMWEDIWYNEIIHKVSYSFAIFERVGYVYCRDPSGVGTPKYNTEKEKSEIIRENVGFLNYDYHFCENKKCKYDIITKLKEYNGNNSKLQLKNFRTHFEVLNNLLKALIRDKDLERKYKKYCAKLLKESIIREKMLNKTE